VDDIKVKWGISPDVRSGYTQDGAVLLDIGHGHYYTLNRVAAHAGTVEKSEHLLIIRRYVRHHGATFG
jgi:hypothetical protein